MDQVIRKLNGSEPIEEQFLNDSSVVIAGNIKSNKLKIIDFVKNLDPILTNGSHDIRLRGVQLLTNVVVSLPKDLLNTKEIEVMTDFLKLRLVDHRSMETPALMCLSYFVNCQAKPPKFDKDLLIYLKEKIPVKAMEPKERKLAYGLVRSITQEINSRSKLADADIIYSLVQIFEGESNPENLLICFRTISYVLKNFQELDAYIDEIFEWLASYYPIDYTPNDSSPTTTITITKSDLVSALYECFYANELIADNLQTLLLEKLDSTLLSTKLESLECLIKCYETFPLNSIKSFNSSLWTAIRMDCLKNLDLVNPKLLDTSYRALRALTAKLSQDRETYFLFISDMYEELSIAFRKPEMDLFGPAARLVANAASPDITGFNYIFKRIIPISRNAIANNDLRPLAGLVYIFESLVQSKLSHRLSQEVIDVVTEFLRDLCVMQSDLNEDALKFIRTLIQYKFEMSEEMVNTVINKLLKSIGKFDTLTEVCLAKICINYRRSDLIFKSREEPIDLESLAKLVTFLDCEGSIDHETEIGVSTKILVYLRIIISELQPMTTQQLSTLGSDRISKFLKDLRLLAIRLFEESKIIERIGYLHGLIANKLDSAELQGIVQDFFSSSYCQQLTPNDHQSNTISRLVYLPVVKFCMKALTMRNHQLSYPMINLMLNYISDPKNPIDSSVQGMKVFGFILSEDDSEFKFDKIDGFQVFFLYKQKLFVQTLKEVKLRIVNQTENMRKLLLIGSLAIQVPHLAASVYKKDQDWMLREFIKVLSITISEKDYRSESSEDELIGIIFESIECILGKSEEEDVSSFIDSLVNLCLKYSQQAKSLHVRRRALICIEGLATSLSDANLLSLRAKVVDDLRISLGDKKRLVRQAAASARCRWILVGQPMGS